MGCTLRLSILVYAALFVKMLWQPTILTMQSTNRLQSTVWPRLVIMIMMMINIIIFHNNNTIKASTNRNASLI